MSYRLFALGNSQMSVQTSKHTKEVGGLQKGADFVKSFALGFDVNVSTFSSICALRV